MNKEWAELNKYMQSQIKKKDSFSNGINILMKLREELMIQIITFKKTLTKEQFCAMPFVNAKGYHSKTIAYSLYHIFRIEDIVAHTVIRKDEQIFFKGNYQIRLNSPIITTGNELMKQEIADFSKQLNIDELFQYIEEVYESTNVLLKQIEFTDLKTKYSEKEKESIRVLKVVSEEEEAKWLIDYWCDKNLKGLIQMPFSRHWIMHVEACLKIKNKICKR